MVTSRATFAPSIFLSYDTPPKSYGEGMESVVNLGLSQDWLPAPKRKEVN